jgi:AcrR family transcriptional regulator
VRQVATAKQPGNGEESPTSPGTGSSASTPVSEGAVVGTSKRSDQTRARILEAAEEVFGRLGFHAASIVEITRQAGVGLGTFYVYFPSKIAIYRRLLRSQQQEFMRAARWAAAGSGDYRETTRAAFKAFFSWMEERPFILRLMREADFIDPSLLEDLYIGPAEEYSKTLEQAMELGYIAKADPRVLAWAIMGMTEYAVVRWIIWPGRSRIDSERFEAFMRIVFRTLAIQPSREG